MKRLFLLMALLVIVTPDLWSQQEGHAGYTPFFTPKVRAELPDEVHETSGLFFHNGRLWTHNDSGGLPVLYALDTATFEVVQHITLSNAKNKDWEDVCTDGERVYVGDFGNNKGNRKNLRIYVFSLHDIPDEGDATLTVDSIRFRFADQTDFNHKKYDHDYDCEAMFATDEHLYLLSKGWKTGTTRLYRLPKLPGNYEAELVNGFDSQGLITGADYDPENCILVLVGYVKSIWKPFLYLIYDFDDAGVKLAHRRFEMPQWTGAQTEGVCFFDEGRCFLSAERSPTMNSRVFVIDFRKIIQKDQKRNRKGQASEQ
ncbi:MAG: hypothetical protein IKT08_08875 [Bacteroidales bacterium]|nr:hypothetical protein [Bacteroidales bacterium]